MIKIVLNGELKQLAAPVSIAELLAAENLAGKRFAVELNGTIIPKIELVTTELKNSDCLEIVMAVGGG